MPRSTSGSPSSPRSKIEAGRTDQIAVRVAGAWEYHAPKIGWTCFIEDEGVLSVYKATGWSPGIAV